MTGTFLHELLIGYLAFNGFILAAVFYTWYASRLVRDWPSTTGKVTSSRVVSNYSMRGLPRVTYTYEVDGKRHTGFRVSPGGAVTGGTYTQGILTSFPEGKDVTVYYNPANPSQAFLDKNSLVQKSLWQWFWLGNIAMPLVVWLGGLMMGR